MTWAIPDYMARGGLFQRAILTVEADKLLIAQFTCKIVVVVL